MSKVITIYDAKTNLSKLVKKAQAGETIYIGAYGIAEAVLAPLPTKKPIKIGLYAHKRVPGYDSTQLIGPDEETNAEIEASINRPFP